MMVTIILKPADTANDALGTKKCSKCSIVLPLSAFDLRSPYYFRRHHPKTDSTCYNSRCHSCSLERYRQYNREHKEQGRNHNREYRSKNSKWFKEYQRRYNKEYRQRNIERLQEQMSKYYLQNKERLKEYRAGYYLIHSGRVKIHHHLRGIEIKTRVLTHYGDNKLACVLCNENNLAALTIDHINGGGTQERTRLRLGGYPFHRWLERCGYPSGYRTLCANCQFIERQRNSCPKRPSSARGRNIVKTRVLAHYGGGKCACVVCGNSTLACLSIHHIDGGGTAHRRESKLYSHQFRMWLESNGYPKGYQTLCMNCQYVKAYGGSILPVD